MSKRTISFKSVGELRTDKKFKREQNLEPIGILTPLSLGNKELFKMSTSLEEQISSNFRSLLLTQKGERLGRYNFGTRLRELTFEFGREEFDTLVGQEIKSAVSKWMPFILLNEFTTTIDRNNNKNTAVLKILINYDIPYINAVNKLLEITLFIGG